MTKLACGPHKNSAAAAMSSGVPSPSRAAPRHHRLHELAAGAVELGDTHRCRDDARRDGVDPCPAASPGDRRGPDANLIGTLGDPVRQTPARRSRFPRARADRAASPSASSRAGVRNRHLGASSIPRLERDEDSGATGCDDRAEGVQHERRAKEIHAENGTDRSLHRRQSGGMHQHIDPPEVGGGRRAGRPPTSCPTRPSPARPRSDPRPGATRPLRRVWKVSNIGQQQRRSAAEPSRRWPAPCHRCRSPRRPDHPHSCHTLPLVIARPTVDRMRLRSPARDERVDPGEVHAGLAGCEPLPHLGCSLAQCGGQSPLSCFAKGRAARPSPSTSSRTPRSTSP